MGNSKGTRFGNKVVIYSGELPGITLRFSDRIILGVTKDQGHFILWLF